MYKLFMEFDNPTEAFTGKRQSVQGFAVHGDYGIVLYHTGVCAMYDLRTRARVPISVCRLGSFNDGVPDNRYTNHANDAMFGRARGESFPLLYVTAGNSGEADEKGYIAYCAVEQLRLEGGKLSAETVQRIYYRDDGIENTKYQSPGWGWPASLVDEENGLYYMFSARFRTKRDLYRPDNAYIVTAFPLPEPSAGDVTLSPQDICDQFELPFNVFFTQGGTVHGGKIWYMFGCGKEAHPNALRVVDLKQRAFVHCEDLTPTEFGHNEVECCAFYGERLLINTQNGKIYEKI